MSSLVLIDNDILIKTACYGLQDDLLAEARSGSHQVIRLGVSEFVIRRYFKKNKNLVSPERAARQADTLIASIEGVEPTDQELKFAAELEEAALRAGLPFDTGESQLAAVLVYRHACLLLTGDKRAIAAAHAICQDLAIGAAFDGKFACLEQAIQFLGGKVGLVEIANRICSEPQADRALTCCCSCSSEDKDEKVIAEGLTSYVEHLRRASGALLVQQLPVSTVVS